MKLHLSKYFLFFLICIILGCHRTKKPFLQRLEECTIENKDIVLENNFYPFNGNEYYKTSEMKKFFTGKVKIDSGFNKNSQGDSILDYKYSDENSYLIFTLEGYSKKKYNFTVAMMEIRSGIIKFKNGIRYDMSRKEFFKAIGHHEVSCDTFHIHENYNGYYFRFVFYNDTLKSISKKYLQ